MIPLDLTAMISNHLKPITRREECMRRTLGSRNLKSWMEGKEMRVSPAAKEGLGNSGDRVR